jgi:hypothetical protein
MRLVLVALLFAGCAPSVTPGIAAHSAILPSQSAAPCPVSGEGTTFLNEVDSFKLTVNAKDMLAPVKSEGPLGTDGTVKLDQVPVGTERLVGLFGESSGTTIWRGVGQHVSITQGQDTPVDILMARLADVTCARGPDDDPRAFHTATVLDDGKILLAGGAKTGSDASGNAACGPGCHNLSATASASLFDPSNGTFINVGTLQNARMFHVAVKLKDGRVIIAGGAQSALVHAPGDSTAPFPIVPADPVSAVEIFDPSTRQFAPLGNDPAGARIFAAGAQTDDGSAIITGGIPAASAVRNDLGNATDSTTICSGSGCQNGPTMASPRAGHAAFRVDSTAVTGVVLWGGSVAANDGNRFQIEALQSGVFESLNVQQMSKARNRFFASCTPYRSFRTLCAGGLSRGDDGSFSTSPSDVFANDADTTLKNEPGAGVYVYSATDGGPQGGVSTGHPPNSTQMTLAAGPLFFGSAAALPGNSRVIIAGGFSSLSFAASDDVELFDEQFIVQAAPTGRAPVAQLSVGGVPRTMRQSRGGLVAAANGDGTIVLTGGESGVDASRTPVSTAEIFADPLTPPLVAE